MAKKESKLSAVKKWKNKFKFKLEYDIANQNVFRLYCIDCKMWESRINLMKNFNETRIIPGTMVVNKDNLIKLINSAPHKQALFLYEDTPNIKYFSAELVNTQLEYLIVLKLDSID